MSTPNIKVYNPFDEYIAATRDPVDAAAIVIRHGYGSKVKVNGRIVYRVGEREQAPYEDTARIVGEEIAATAHRHRAERVRKYNEQEVTS